MRLVLVSALVLGAGTTLVLSELRWFCRPSLPDRLRPYGPGGLADRTRRRSLSVESFRDVVGPLCQAVGEHAARALGVSEELATRLERIHSPLDVTAFRTRQLGWSLAGFAPDHGQDRRVEPLPPSHRALAWAKDPSPGRQTP